MNQLFGYHIYEPSNSNSYKVRLKFYDDYNISKMPYAFDIKNYDYEDIWYQNMTENPFILLRKYREAKGLLLMIESVLDKETEESRHNEMIVYVKAKNIINLTENTVLNSTQLIPKNVYYLMKIIIIILT